MSFQKFRSRRYRVKPTARRSYDRTSNPEIEADYKGVKQIIASDKIIIYENVFLLAS
jgi:hypothetical protein